MLTVAVVLVFLYRPLGDYMARVYTDKTHRRAERAVYAVTGVDPDQGQTWQAYARALLAFSAVGMLVLYGIQRLQEWLPYSMDLPAVESGLAFNISASFVTNTNWQSYSGEQTMGYAVQALGLMVQNFVSAAVGMAVAVSLVRGFAACRSAAIGNFWVDLVRGTGRILLPIAFIGAVILMAGGVIQNLHGPIDVAAIAGGVQSLPGGAVASQEAIKLLGTNGGGFFNANSAHPFENPTAWTNLFEVLLMLIVPFTLPRAFGRIVGDDRQGRAVAVTMGILFLVCTGVLAAFEAFGHGTATQLAGAAMEGKEQRFGIGSSTVFGATSTLTSTGAVDSMHDSYTALGGMMTMLNMMLGEVAPGGVGSGLYGMLMSAIVAVFLGGLMVGRTPEYLGKKIGPREMKLASLYILVTPCLVLAGVGVSLAVPSLRASVEGTSLLNPGSHGFSELLYAFTSAANNNGSAFGGITANTPWLNASLGVAMLLGRFVPIVLVLSLAGSLAVQDPVPATAGTLPTHRPLFVALLFGVVVIIAALTYFPMLALGPLAEGLL
nr:potassium-transporting ATPase subunit KdpA [Actinomyces sp.]